MPKKLHSYFEALSIRRKMTYIILGFVLILLTNWIVKRHQPEMALF